MFIAPLGICNEPPTAEEIIYTAVQAVMFDKDESAYAPTVEYLIKAWAELITHEFYEKHGRDMKIRWVRGIPAEGVYRKAYLVINPSEDDAWWPDALPYDADLPVEFIKIIAQGLARKDLAQKQAFFDYMKRTEGKDATSG